jgi:hypothetical protein
MPNKSCLEKLADYMIKKGETSCRKLAEIFNTSKSSISRKQHKLRNRENMPGASYFETEQGKRWILRMAVACIFIFGNISGVGSERISLFFSLIYATSFIGLSRSSAVKIEDQIDDIIIRFKEKHDKIIKDKAHEIEITPGGDETFFTDQMLIVLMELKSGFIFVEKPEEKRDHETWEGNALPWLSKFKLIRCFLSDKAKALLKLAEKSLFVSRIPDLFHIMNDISKVMRFSFSRLKKGTEKSIDEMNKLIAKGVDVAKNQVIIAKLTIELQSISFDQNIYQRNLRKLSTSLHPFDILSTRKQSTANVENKMITSLKKIKTIKEKHSISDSGNKLARAEKQIPDSAKLVDQWWGWLDTSLDSENITPEIKAWLMDYLLPYIYWRSQIKKTCSKKIKRCYEISMKVALSELKSHPLTQQLTSDLDNSGWVKWAENMTDIFIRTTSSIEGRNGWLSQIHFNGRGLSEKRVLSQAAIHNYFLKRSNNTTACERLSDIIPEDMFEFIMERIGPLPEPRNGKGRRWLDPLVSLAVPG